MCRRSVSDIRRLVYDLRPPALDELGLVGALKEGALACETDGRRVVVQAPELPATAAGCRRGGRLSHRPGSAHQCRSATPSAAPARSVLQSTRAWMWRSKTTGWACRAAAHRGRADARCGSGQQSSVGPASSNRCRRAARGSGRTCRWPEGRRWTLSASWLPTITLSSAAGCGGSSPPPRRPDRG